MISTVKRAAVALAVLVSLVPVSAAAADIRSATDVRADTPQAAAGVFYLRNYATTRCLTVRGSADGAPAVQYDCLGYRDQKWVISDYTNPSGAYSYSVLRNLNSGLCLSFKGTDTHYGAPAFQYHCHGGADQRWIRKLNIRGGYTYRNWQTGNCLSVQGANNVPDAPAFQYWCHEGDDQVWVLMAAA